MNLEREFDVLIIGAGVLGLSAAFHLSGKGLRIGVLEQFELGHPFGSSHGDSRITRSIYMDPKYFRLIQRARSEEWPELEEAARRRLIHPNPGCFIGKGNIFDGFLQSAAVANLPVRKLDPSEARKRFDAFRFGDDAAVILDETAGVVAAKETMDSLAKLAVERQIAILENTKALALEPAAGTIRVLTERGEFCAGRLIAAAGPWMPRLIPQFKEMATPIRQTVGYFQMKGDIDRYRIGRFPVWAHIGDGSIFYGLPEFGSPGIKVAEHLVQGAGSDPDENPEPPLSKKEKLIKFVQTQFAHPIERVVKFETCMYTVAPKERFILGPLPGEPRIIAASCCSGHAFKFAPLLGKIAADLALQGQTNIAEFEEARELFSVSPEELPVQSE